MSTTLSFAQAKQNREDQKAFERWAAHYMKQSHENVLSALVREHENDFPMRRSAIRSIQMKHKALVHVLTERARTQFLRNLLDEIKAQRI